MMSESDTGCQTQGSMIKDHIQHIWRQTKPGTWGPVSRKVVLDRPLLHTSVLKNICGGEVASALLSCSNCVKWGALG